MAESESGHAPMLRWPPLSIPALRRSDAPRSGNSSHSSPIRWFTPRRRSDYDRIRKEPADFCVSTIEALTEVLNVLEPDGAPFDPLLLPFRTMVDRQERFATEVAGARPLAVAEWAASMTPRALLVKLS